MAAPAHYAGQGRTGQRAPQVSAGNAGSPVVAAVRLLTGFAGFGAGTVNLAISASIVAAAASAPEPAMPVTGVAAAVWGVALLAGAVVFLARDRPAGGPWVLSVLAVAAAVHLAATALTPAAPAASNLSLTQLSAMLLTLTIIASLGWLQRTAEQQHSERQDSDWQHGERQQVPAVPAGAGVRPGRLLLGAFAGAVLVAGITTPGLAASTAGQYAVPHGSHGNVVPGGHHQR